MKYRVLMEDQVNGDKFNFAIPVEAAGMFSAELEAKLEFPEANVVEIREVVDVAA